MKTGFSQTCKLYYIRSPPPAFGSSPFFERSDRNVQLEWQSRSTWGVESNERDLSRVSYLLNTENPFKVGQLSVGLCVLSVPLDTIRVEGCGGRRDPQKTRRPICMHGEILIGFVAHRRIFDKFWSPIWNPFCMVVMIMTSSSPGLKKNEFSVQEAKWLLAVNIP